MQNQETALFGGGESCNHSGTYYFAHLLSWIQISTFPIINRIDYEFEPPKIDVKSMINGVFYGGVLSGI